MASANPANQSPGEAEAEIAVKRRFIGEKKKLKRETQHRKKFREKISGINDDVSGFFFYYNFPPKRYFGSTDNIWSLIWCCTEFTFDLMKTLGVLSNQNQPLTLSHSWWDTDCRESSNVVSLPEPDNWVDGFNCSKRNWAGTERLFPKLCLNEAWDFKLVWLKTHLK